MHITMTREELRELFKLSENGLKTLIKRDKLEERLYLNGYKLEKQYKEGRYTLYDLSIIDTNEWIKLQQKYNIRKREEHTKYSKARIENGDSSRNKLLKNYDIHISGKIAKEYDTILCKEDIMQLDKEVYYLIKKETGEMIEITNEEFKDFWHNNMTAKNAIEQVDKQLDSKAIPKAIGDIYKHKILEKLDNKEGYIAVTFKTYKQATQAQKFLDLINKLK